MSVSAISSSSDPYSTAAQGAAQRRQELQALATALKSGDLTAAQNAFGSLQSSSTSSQTSTVQASGQTAQSSNLQSLAGALQSGDLAGAQAAFAALEKGHHGHHHHAQANAAPTTAADGTPTNAVGDVTQLVGTTFSGKG